MYELADLEGGEAGCSCAELLWRYLQLDSIQDLFSLSLTVGLCSAALEDIVSTLM